MDRNDMETEVIYWLDKWSRRKHIECRHLFGLYKKRLMKDKYLTDGMVDHICLFLKRERGYDLSDLLESISDLKGPPPPEPTATLESFF